MTDHCAVEECAEPAIALLGDRPLCRSHFLLDSYRRLETIAAQIRQPEFREAQAEDVGRTLEDCMRYAADIACAPVPPANLEKARVLDILLWASELHGFLRRGPRIPAKIQMLLRSEAPEKPWEEKVETLTLSRHGLQIACGHEVKVNEVLTCVRLDNGCRAQARVVWTRRRESGPADAGLEFLTDENFWGLGSDGVATASNF
jgi:hypothetical protein